MYNLNQSVMKNYYFEPEIINKLSEQATWAKDLDDVRPFQLICSTLETLHNIYGAKRWVSSSYKANHMVRERITQQEYDDVQCACLSLLRSIKNIRWNIGDSVNHVFEKYPDVYWDLMQLEQQLELIFTLCFMFRA